jgi:hypothetical protein
MQVSTIARFGRLATVGAKPEHRRFRLRFSSHV